MKATAVTNAMTEEDRTAVTDRRITDEELAQLVERTEEASTAFIRGDMERYLELTPHARGFTLMNPFGGPPARYEDRAESLRAAASYFTGGEATIELVETHVWSDTVVLVMIERQHGQVGGLPDQDWSLRVTQVYRRAGSDWQVVHRTLTRLCIRSIWNGRARSPAADAGSGEVEAIEAHDLVPRRHEVADEPLLRVVTGVDLGEGAEL
jgi:ketosteroid isomerase-like protein